MSGLSLRVLLADPDEASRASIERALESAGYCVDTVASGSEVIAECESDPPDILIVDVHLPDMDGFEVCEHVRYETREADVTIIVMTECSDEMTRHYLGPMVEYVGGDFFFVKPCDSNLLLHLLDDLLEEDAPVDRRRVGACPTRAVWPTHCPPSMASLG